MSSLQIIDKRPKSPPNKPGTPEWCAQVKETALQQALAAVEKSKISCSDVVHLMKIRRALTERVQLNRKVTWADPESWKTDAEPDFDPPKAF